MGTTLHMQNSINISEKSTGSDSKGMSCLHHHQTKLSKGLGLPQEKIQRDKMRKRQRKSKTWIESQAQPQGNQKQLQPGMNAYKGKGNFKPTP